MSEESDYGPDGYPTQRKIMELLEDGVPLFCYNADGTVNRELTEAEIIERAYRHAPDS